MFVPKLLFCVSVLSTSQIVFVLTERRCLDCVSIDSCESSLDFIRKLRDGTLSPEDRRMTLDAFCGFDERDHRTQKVCCSDFPKNVQTFVQTTNEIDPIENHHNIGLLPTSCGNMDGSRILSGKIVKLYEFPWMTLISYHSPVGLDFRCTGTVINSRYILTAAHCVIRHGRLKDIAGVRVGEHDYSTQEDCQGSYDDMICESKIQDLEVEEIIPHARFTERPPIEADIALLRLKKAIIMTNNAAPVCLPVYSNLRNSNLAGKKGTVAGWSLLGHQANSTKLMKEEVTILTSDTCNRYYNRTGYQGTSFCAGPEINDYCNSISGGPLMVESDYNGSIRLVQVGIDSFGPVKCSLALPDAYTDVAKYMEWILDNMRE